MTNTDVDTGSADLAKLLLERGATEAPLRDHPDGGKIMLVPQGYKADHLLDPDREAKVTRRSPSFFETSSFVDYVNDFKVPDQTRIFVHPEELKAVAVIDYDRVGFPDRGVHRATLKLALSTEWMVWITAAADTKRQGLTQEEFAEFLEEHGINVRTPTAAELIELVTKMQITRNVNYKRSINLQDGRQQFTYMNENESGETAFPARLELGIPVFKGGEHYKVTVLLRYRLQDGGSLRFGLIVHRMEEILRDAFQGDLKAIQEKTEVPVHIGAVA